MQMVERRKIGRVPYPSRGVLVLCDTQEIIHVGVRDLGPIGVGVKVPHDTKSIVGCNVILVCENLIMYANVVRQDPLPEGDWVVGVAGRKFPQDVLQYLFDSLEMKAQSEKEGK